MFYTQQQQRKQLTGYQVLVLFCRQDFGNSGQKFPGLWKLFEKKSFQDFGNCWTRRSKLWKLLDKVLTTLEMLPRTRFPVHDGSKE